MTYTLIFHPDGSEPTTADFRVMGAATSPPRHAIGFDTIDQLVRYLDERDWPEEHKPWVRNGTEVMTPDEVVGLLPD